MGSVQNPNVASTLDTSTRPLRSLVTSLNVLERWTFILSTLFIVLGSKHTLRFSHLVLLLLLDYEASQLTHWYWALRMTPKFLYSLQLSVKFGFYCIWYSSSSLHYRNHWRIYIKMNFGMEFSNSLKNIGKQPSNFFIYCNTSWNWQKTWSSGTLF